MIGAWWLWAQSYILPGLVPLAIPILIVLRAVLKREKRPAPAAVAAPPGLLPIAMATHERDFHKAEFTALKSEIAELLKAAAAHFQYAVIASGAIFTWLTTTHKANEVPYLDPKAFVGLVLWLPLIISGLLFSLSLVAYMRMEAMGRYLQKLEGDLGHPARGWKKEFLREPGTIGPILAWGWIVLIVGDLGGCRTIYAEWSLSYL